jgi:hypothetical protein
MPFVSKAQIRWGHSPAGIRALGGKRKVEEWQSETPKGLPEKVKKPGRMRRAAERAEENG